MRKITLHNNFNSTSINLYNSTTLVSDITGFGSKYEIKQSKTTVSEIKPVFEKITLDIYFGVNGDAYTDYTTLMTLIGGNIKGQLSLEYDYGSGSRFCDVVLENAPKTQKTRYNVLKETFVFLRTSWWYEKFEYLFTSNNDTKKLPYNNTYYPFELILRAYLEAQEGEDLNKNVNLIFKRVSDAGTELARVEYDTITDATKKSIHINGETKSVYEKLDVAPFTKTRTYQKINNEFKTFLYIAPGHEERINFTGATDAPSLIISARVLFKHWLVD